MATSTATSNSAAADFAAIAATAAIASSYCGSGATVLLEAAADGATQPLGATNKHGCRVPALETVVLLAKVVSPPQLCAVGREECDGSRPHLQLTNHGGTSSVRSDDRAAGWSQT